MLSDRVQKNKTGKTNTSRFIIKMNGGCQNPVHFTNYKLLLRLNKGDL